MKNYLIALIVLVGCQSMEKAAVSTNYYFVTTLGTDTLAVEQVTLTADAIASTVLLRSPTLSVQQAKLEFTSDGNLRNYVREVIDPISDSTLIQEEVSWMGDSLTQTLTRNGNKQMSNITVNESIIPFIDMVHWPFDLMIKKAFESDSPVSQPVFSGRRTFEFEVTKVGDDSVTVRHPSRGVMGVTTTSDGLLQFLEAKRTTRALTVQRVDALDMDAVLERFISNDGQNPFGQLSGRGSFEETIDDVTYTIDFGTPQKRGRVIWGELVRYGKRWRTGANRATHLSISAPITLGGETIPAGDYTLYSIPEEDGGTLIVNKQTGQNGQQYDEEMDLVRIPMLAIPLDTVVESFEVAVEPYEDGWALMLKWDTTAMIVPVK